MKKQSLLIIALLSFFGFVNAQEGPVLKLDETNYDFGKIKEDGGSVSHTFKVVNKGNKPLKIERVQPACGCTTPDWTKEEIKPGKEGFVKATFDPMGRPGVFSKSVTIYSNTTPSVHLITFSGDVIPRTKTFEDSFPASVGNLRFKFNHINFGNIKNNITDTIGYFTLYNQSNKPMVIKSLKAPAHITANLPITLPSRKETILAIHYNASAANDYGLIMGQCKLVTDDENSPEKQISVIADIHQYIPNMSEKDLLKAPKVSFDKTEHNFGDLKQGEIVSTIFKLKNTGKQNLEILKVKTTCGCTVVEPDKKLLKPGETSDIKITYSSAGKSGDEKKDVTIITNDPVNTEPSVRIKANVLVPKN